MKKVILDYINLCEKWKVEIKELHWSAKNLSQHKLCDDIASAISDFEDYVSEVEQSISGKISLNTLKPKKAEVTSLKSFVSGVISSSQSFLKELDGMGDKYVGIKSECESFIGTMQRNLYLVNFTLKEEMKERIRARMVNEAMPKSPSSVDGEFDKFIGRRPKTIKSRINQIYKLVKKYGIDSRKYHDEAWQAIDDYHNVISSLGCDVELKPCADLVHADSIYSDGGYCDYDEYDHMPRSKQYAIKITFDDGMVISGYIKCMAAGTVKDPFSSYDTCIVLWPKSSNVLSETALNYDVDNFSGRWYKDDDDWGDYIDDEGYLDDPYEKDSIEYELWDDAWNGDGSKSPKDLENEYSWDRFDHKPISQGLDDYYQVGKGAIPREVDDAIRIRNANNDWSDRELRNRDRMMGKWVDGTRDADEIGDSWEDLHYFEGKSPIKVNESQLKGIVRDAAINVIRESGINIKPSKKGTFKAAASKHGKSVQGFANQVLNNKDKYSSAMVKKANFAKNAKKWNKG